MNQFNDILAQIPIQYDLFALLVFTNIVLGLLICSTILFNKKSENQAILFLGSFVLLVSFVQLDFFLSYTGLMKKVLWMYNSTEVLALLIPLCIYFFVLNLLKQEQIKFQKNWVHLIVPVLYFISQLGFYSQSNIVKLDNYVFGFYPHLPRLDYQSSIWLDFSNTVGSLFHYLLIAVFLIYIFLSIKVIREYNFLMNKNFFKPKEAGKLHKYNFSIYIIGLLVVTSIVTIIVFTIYTNDLGERYIMVIPLIGVLAISFLMMSRSHFFDKSWLLEKYHTSGLNLSASDILKKITSFVEAEHYYLQKNGSLKNLSTQLSLSPTYLSQVINNQTGQNFNDFINQYRIEEAKKRLVEDAYTHLSIAGIGETVGFKSKSAFYTAFKKHTQFTPAAFAKMAKSENSTRK